MKYWITDSFGGVSTVTSDHIVRMDGYIEMFLSGEIIAIFYRPVRVIAEDETESRN